MKLNHISLALMLGIGVITSCESKLDVVNVNRQTANTFGQTADERAPDQPLQVDHGVVMLAPEFVAQPGHGGAHMRRAGTKRPRRLWKSGRLPLPILRAEIRRFRPPFHRRFRREPDRRAEAEFLREVSALPSEP